MKTATLSFTRAPHSPEVARDEIIGRSPAITTVLDLLARVAPPDTPVLICGETGTGKGVDSAHVAFALAPRSETVHSCEPCGDFFAGIEPASLDRLLSDNWPGNIRQLQNVLERSAILCDEELLHVPQTFTTETAPPARDMSPLADALTTSECHLIVDAPDQACGRVSGPNGAAARLGISPSTLESKIRRLRIDKSRFRVRRP